MKIERLNDHQIRCTLTREDLAKRGLRLSEFAYGTKKARELFQDIMEQAYSEVGFEADDCPLMIEAVPMGPECLVLLVTQVEDPEELDTRFSVFGPMVDEPDEEDYDAEEGEDNPFSRLLRGLQDGDLTDYSSLSDKYAARLNLNGVRQMTGRHAAPDEAPEKKARPAVRIFSFSSLHEVRRAVTRITDLTAAGSNTLYRANGDRCFYLCLHQPDTDKPGSDFVSLCATLAEYGAAAATESLSEEYLVEHCEALIRDNALQTLAGI